MPMDLRFLCRTRPSTAIARWVGGFRQINQVCSNHPWHTRSRQTLHTAHRDINPPTNLFPHATCNLRRLWSTRTLCGGMYGWAVVDDRLDLIPSHPPIGRIIPLRWVLGRRSRTRPRPRTRTWARTWARTRTPSMWCHAWRIGYHDQWVRASAANATTNDATAPSPSRTASNLIRASAPTMSIRSICMALGRPIHAWMPSLELTNGAMHVYATRPSTFPHNHYHHPICESCHCQCRMITSTWADTCAQSLGAWMGGRS